MGIPGNLGNSQGHFTKPGIPLHYFRLQKAGRKLARKQARFRVLEPIAYKLAALARVSDILLAARFFGQFYRQLMQKILRLLCLQCI
jgi:hypothetical protein